MGAISRTMTLVVTSALEATIVNLEEASLLSCQLYAFLASRV
jgi:hypothetical protein